MTAERLYPKSVDEHLKAVERSALNGEKRSSLEDAPVILKLLGVRDYSFGYHETSIPQKPTIIAANHFVPESYRHFHRKLSMTWKSIETTALILIGLRRLTDKEVIYLLTNEAPDKVFLKTIKARRAQKAITPCYGWIDAGSRANGLSTIRECCTVLQSGKALGIYPEGKVSYTLQPHDKRVESLFMMLGKRGIDYQILPVSIEQTNGRYLVSFGKVLDPTGNPENIAIKTMQAIAQNLPSKIRGHYR